MITTKILKEYGFVKMRETYESLKYKKGSIIIEAYLGENGGGFAHNFKPINTEKELVDLLIKYEFQVIL
jgi:hypothetical protein